MKRVRLTAVMAALVLVAVLVAGPAMAKVLIKTQSLYSTSLPVLGEAIPWFAKSVKEASGGEVIFKIYEPGKLVAPKEILESVSKKRVAAGYASAGFWQGKIPAAALFSAIPFGPEADEYLAWMFYGNGLKLYQEMYDSNGYNVKVLPLAIISPETSGWFNKEIKTVDDLKGLKMRFFGLGGRVMEKLGVNVTLTAPGEVFPALEKGAIDATEFSMPSLDRKMGFYKVAKYNYYPGWHQQATFTELIINKDVWNKLSPANRKLIEMCTMASLVNSLALGEATQGVIIGENAKKFGVKNRYWSPEILAAYKKAWDEVVAEMSAKDPLFKKVWDDLSKFRADYANWAAVGFLPRPKPPKD